ncbi:bifunctional folylpolyglutamate synthase/dihydrofolate synthase [bacterium]|nr:bifunctional folylpolyglutamate synthase/dihydrofolate synthase [bacterium]
MDYERALSHLYGLESKLGWDLKLERVRAALALLGSPEAAVPAVLVAGTNGKGTCCAVVHSILCEAGVNAGLYTSPHLVDFTERIRIGRRTIARDAVASGIERIVEETGRAGIELTFFEMATVLAFDEFAREGVAAAVLEVGLGGRLDATNVSDPVASAVTTIGFDHEEFLGRTLEAIAREKAGVMRPGRAVVLGPRMPGEARGALLAEAARVGARPVESDPSRGELDALALLGEHLRDDAAVGLALLEEAGRASSAFRVDASAVRAGLASVRWPGRLDVVRREPLVVVDGAHNPDGVEALLRSMPAVFGSTRPRLLFAALADKPWREMAGRLSPFVSEAIVTGIDGPRAVAPAELATAFAIPVRVEPDPGRALRSLLDRPGDGPVLVAGSLYLAGSVYRFLIEQGGMESVFDRGPGAAA